MSSSNSNSTSTPPVASSPIPIGGAQRARGRSYSISSSISSSSPSSTADLPTPPSHAATLPRLSIPSPSTSPILSYFLGQSPTTKAPVANAPFPGMRRNFGVPVFDNDEETKEIPVATHARRASITVANRFSNQSQPTSSPKTDDRGSGLLRRLSLSTSAYGKPQLDALRNAGPPSPPPNSAVNPTPQSLPHPTTRPRRSATLNVDSSAHKARRAPSPMGERILKGQFDGFN